VQEAPDPQRPPVPRSIGLGLAVGLAVAIAAVGVAYSFIAIPTYLLAQSDPNGLNRPFIRNALLYWGLPIGGLLGLACGALVGVWYGRGGRLPTDRTPE
jgi:hypothetical protein